MSVQLAPRQVRHSPPGNIGGKGPLRLTTNGVSSRPQHHATLKEKVAFLSSEAFFKVTPGLGSDAFRLYTPVVRQSWVRPSRDSSGAPVPSNQISNSASFATRKLAKLQLKKVWMSRMLAQDLHHDAWNAVHDYTQFSPGATPSRSSKYIYN